MLVATWLPRPRCALGLGGRNVPAPCRRGSYTLPSLGRPPSTTKTKADALSSLVSARTSLRGCCLGSSRCAMHITSSPRSARTWRKILMLGGHLSGPPSSWYWMPNARLFGAAARHRQASTRLPLARPHLHITKECVLQRLRARVTEETFRVPEQHVLKEGILFAGVLAHVQEDHIVLSAAFGGASVYRRTKTQLRASMPPPPRTGG